MQHFKFMKKPKREPDHAKKIESCLLHAQLQRTQKSPLASESFHIVDRPYKAHLNVYFTESQWDADILVYVTSYSNRSRGHDEIWHYSEIEGNADTLIYPVEKPFLADLRVCLVDSEYKARWLRKRKIKSRQQFKK